MSSNDKIHPDREGCFYLKRFEYTFNYTRNQLIDIVDNYVFNEQKNKKELTLLYKTYVPRFGYNRIIGNGEKQ